MEMNRPQELRQFISGPVHNSSAKRKCLLMSTSLSGTERPSLSNAVLLSKNISTNTHRSFDAIRLTALCDSIS